MKLYVQGSGGFGKSRVVRMQGLQGFGLKGGVHSVGFRGLREV